MAMAANQWLPWDTAVDENAAAIIGAAAVLSGFTRLTV